MNNKDLIILLLVILVAVSSFGLGWITHKRTQHSDTQTQIERLKIEKLKLEIWDIRRKHERINNK